MQLGEPGVFLLETVTLHLFLHVTALHVASQKNTTKRKMSRNLTHSPHREALKTLTLQRAAGTWAVLHTLISLWSVLLHSAYLSFSLWRVCKVKNPFTPCRWM